jgi:hypothetical protein
LPRASLAWALEWALEWALSRAMIVLTQEPHPVPASQLRATSLTVHAPLAMHPRTSASVTARQMQTYMVPLPLDRVVR